MLIFRRRTTLGRVDLDHGIGQVRAKSIAEKANVDFTKKIRDLTEDEVNRIRTIIEQEGRVEGDLRKEIQMNIRRLIEVQAYRGIRHRRNLPVRGQRTHTSRAPGRARAAAPLPARNRSRVRRAKAGI